MSMDSSTSECPTSLLDLLIKTEKATEETEDPLDGIGNIGEVVISQMANDAFNLDIQESICQNAFKLFDQAMSYTKPVSLPKRKYTRLKAQAQSEIPLPPNTIAAVVQASPAVAKSPNHESNSKRFQKADLSIGLHPRAKFDVPVAEFFEKNQKASIQFNVLHESIEQQKTQRLDDQVNKDVERLLQTACRIYGPKKWSEAEKIEFSKYCRSLRTGSLSNADKIALREFYARAYNKIEGSIPEPNLKIENSIRKARTSMDSTIKVESAPVETQKIVVTSPMKRKTNHKEEEEMFYQKRPALEASQETPKPEAQEEGDDDLLDGGSSSIFPSKISFTPFHPGMKYVREKEFRIAVINIFMDAVNIANSAKKRGRPKLISRPAVQAPSSPSKIQEEQSKLQEDIVMRKKNSVEFLMGKMNEKMEDNSKVWTAEEARELGRFFDMFKVKMNFTIVQTKELGHFLRKSFGRLEQYEIERENDAALQEKRKYWQEYKKNHEPVKRPRQKHRPNIMRSAPVRPYIKQNLDTTGETEDEKKKRKAAYLRQWRVKKAEKQSEAIGSLVESVNAMPTEPPAESEADNSSHD